MGLVTSTQFGVLRRFTILNNRVITWPTSPITLLQGQGGGRLFWPMAIRIWCTGGGSDPSSFVDYGNINAGATITVKVADITGATNVCSTVGTVTLSPTAIMTGSPNQQVRLVHLDMIGSPFGGGNVTLQF